MFGGIETSTFLDETLWTVAIWIVKYSVLAFYWRLFAGTRRSVRVVICALTAIVACWGIAVVRFRLLQLVVLLSWYYSRIIDDDLGGLDGLLLFCRLLNGTLFFQQSYLALRGLLGATHLPRFSASRPAGATALEASNAKKTKGYLDCRICLWWPVSCSYFLSIACIHRGLDLELGSLTDKILASSVTIISIVRLVNVLGRTSGNPFVWSTVEVNSSIICGQYRNPSSIWDSKNKTY